jgi:ABC-type branched-subunit amino acid transport system ATPase component
MIKNLTLLDKVSGYVAPSMLLALIGVSGAGKTTLLDVLAKRKNIGRVEGTLLLNSRPPDKFYHRCAIGSDRQTVVVDSDIQRCRRRVAGTLGMWSKRMCTFRARRCWRPWSLPLDAACHGLYGAVPHSPNAVGR